VSYKKNTNVPEKKKQSNNIISKNTLQMSTMKLDDLSKKQPKRLLAKVFTKRKIHGYDSLSFLVVVSFC